MRIDIIFHIDKPIRVAILPATIKSIIIIPIKLISIVFMNS